MRSILFLAFFVVRACVVSFDTPCFAAETDRAAAVLQRELGVTVGGGDGSSFENAIIIRAPNVETETVAEWEYISLRYRLWQFQRTEIVRYKGKVYNVWTYYEAIRYHSFPD